MIIAKKLLLGETNEAQKWRDALLHRNRKMKFYVLVIHPEHVYPLEILTNQEFLRVDADDIRYRVIGMAENYGEALELFQQAVEEVMKSDPEIRQLKQKLQEIYV